VAKRSRPPARTSQRATQRRGKPIEYILGKGTSRLLDVRVNADEIRLLVNGPTMLYGACRLLTSLDAAAGATFQAWNDLAGALTCTSHCGLNGKTDIPVVVLPSRIGTCLEFGTGPMSMYLATVVLRPKRRGTTFRQVIDDAFGNPGVRYQAFIVPEPATGHLEHDASIFDPARFPENAPEPGPTPDEHDHGHAAGGGGSHDSHVHRRPRPRSPRQRRSRG
jgi:hypothetical protein